MSAEAETQHRFSHEAMATRFEVLVAGEARDYAQQAAAAVFAEVDAIEGVLSRYVESSDITQINHAGKDNAVRIGECAFSCLETAQRLWTDTGGVFDITVGPLLACWRNPDKSPRTPSLGELAEARKRVGMDLVELSRDTLSVRLKADGMTLDLGGIGKGFSLDRAAVILDDWSITAALISCESTVLALSAPPGAAGWEAAVGGADANTPATGKVLLQHRALSGSGVYLKGRHIIDPRTGKPVAGRKGSWSIAGAGGIADALSTTFMILSTQEVQRYCESHPGVCAMLLAEENGENAYQRFGPWESVVYEPLGREPAGSV